ncbi:MAG: hypothetical protein WKG01_30545 [Kofleriaceae bacterium]
MSIALLIRDAKDAEQRLVPIATQRAFAAKWLPGASGLGLQWVDLMETGFEVTPDNHADTLDELTRLREWLTARDEAHEIERLDRLLAELRSLHSIVAYCLLGVAAPRRWVGCVCRVCCRMALQLCDNVEPRGRPAGCGKGGVRFPELSMVLAA